MSARTPGRYVTKALGLSAQTARSIWYRYFYLSWVHFGRGVTFAGPIRCAGVTGTIFVGDRTFLGPNISLAAAEGGNLALGTDVSINQGTVLSARQSVVIGDGTRVGDHCSVRDSDHRLDPERPLLDSGFVTKPVVIGANVWIGRQVTIMPGVTIGDGAVIGAHSLVTRDVPPRTVAFGTPARIHRTLP